MQYTLGTMTRCDGSAESPVKRRSERPSVLEFAPGDGTSYAVLVCKPCPTNNSEDMAIAFVGDVYSGHDGIMLGRTGRMRRIGKPSKYDLAVLTYLATLALGWAVSEPPCLATRRLAAQAAAARGYPLGE